jgi:hypothetical protein
MSNLSRLRAHEQPVRPRNQHQCHHAVDDEQFDLRHEMHGRGAAYPHYQRADQRAFDRAHAADRDDGEGEHDHLDADAERDGDFRRHHCAAERAQRRADQESDRVDTRNIDAESGCRLAIKNDRGKQPAVSRELERPIGKDGQRGSNCNEDDIVVR